MRRPQQIERHPEHGRVDRERDAQVRGEPVLAYPWIVDQAALHHVPAHRTLQAAEEKNAGELPSQLAIDAPAREKIEKGREERHADRAAEQAMTILPPKDAFELVERHAAIHLPILGRELVPGESVLPLRVVQRRHGADDGLPLDDRQSRVREAGNPADDHHQEEQDAAGEKPERDRCR